MCVYSRKLKEFVCKIQHILVPLCHCFQAFCSSTSFPMECSPAQKKSLSFCMSPPKVAIPSRNVNLLWCGSSTGCSGYSLHTAPLLTLLSLLLLPIIFLFILFCLTIPFCPLKYCFTEVPPALLMGSAVSYGGSIAESAGTWWKQLCPARGSPPEFFPGRTPLQLIHCQSLNTYMQFRSQTKQKKNSNKLTNVLFTSKQSLYNLNSAVNLCKSHNENRI